MSTADRDAAERGRTGGAAMRARTWTVAANYRDPADYGIPELPEWTVYRAADGRLAFAGDGDEAYVAAADPVHVRR